MDSGSSQNCVYQHACLWSPVEGAGAYASPVDIVGRDLFGLRQAEYALLKAELGVGRAHESAVPSGKHHGQALWCESA